MRDLRYALRSLVRTPAVTLVAVATLALGVGANTAIFSVVYGVLIAPLPYPGADRIVIPWRHNPKMGLSISPAAADLDRWKAAASLESVAMYRTEPLVFTGGPEPESMRVCRIDAGLLGFTGTAPVLGRAFTPGDAAAETAARVVILTDRIWRTRFGGARDVVGRRLTLGDRTFEVVGVLPPSFQLPLGIVDMVAPMAPAQGKDQGLPNAVARLKPGVSVAAAEAELTGFGVDGFGDGKDWTIKLERPVDRAGQWFRRALYILFGAVGFVLLIACANVANIMLARHASREREMAIRIALGAGRGRLIRQLLVESLCLALAGGAAGIALGAWGIQAIVALRPPELSELERIGLSRPMLAFGFGVSILTGLLFGLLPAIGASRGGLSDGLRLGSRARGSARGAFARRALSVAEIALALVLLAGAGLLVRSYLRLQQADLGFRPERVLVVRVSLPQARYATPASRASFTTDLAGLVRKLPDVRHATVASGVPPRGGITFGRLEIDGRTLPAAGGSTTFGGGWIAPGYFEALGIPLRLGRAFADSDLTAAEPPIIVNEAVVKQYFPNESPLGHRIRLNPKAPWRTIVGVAGNVRASGGIDSLQLYHPMGPASMFPDVTLLVATGGDPRRLVAAVKGQAWTLDPRLPFERIETLEERVSESRARPRFNLALLSAFAALGLLLATIGVYGVISYSVGLRSQEIGVRMALGALPADIRRAVLGEAMTLSAIGTVAGLAGALALTRLLTSMLYEVSAIDPWSLSAVAATLAAATMAAAWVPARRAMRVDPMRVLRAE